MRVFLIGSNGLVATAVGRYFSRLGIELDVVGRTFPRLYRPRRFVPADLTNIRPETLDDIRCSGYDLIVYAAGAGVHPDLREDSDQIFALNVAFPTGLVSHLMRCGYGGAVVTFGSYFEIGESGADKAWTEEDVMSSTCHVPNSYCVSKRMLTRFASSIDVDFKYYHLILPTVYAEYEASKRLIPYTVANIQNGIHGRYTSGNQVRQYVYADDVADMIRGLHEKSCASGLYNVPGGDTLSVREVVKTIYEESKVFMPNDMFGTAERDDAQMLDLRLDTTKLCSQIRRSGGRNIRAYAKQLFSKLPDCRHKDTAK